MHPRVQQALLDSGVEYRIRNHADCPKPIRSPQDFADCLGYELGRITNTLFSRSIRRDKYALVVAPMTAKIDFSVVAAALDCPRFEVADKAELEAMLNYPPQGVSPIGAQGHSVFIDESLSKYPTILIGSGVTGVEIELALAALVQLCSAQLKALSKA
jgi:Cys-tRNA(Pro)/Cys-tRNA(Cys) deacylase